MIVKKSYQVEYIYPKITIFKYCRLLIYIDGKQKGEWGKDGF